MRPLRRLFCIALLALALPLQALAAVSALPCAHHQDQPAAATEHAHCHEAPADAAAMDDAADAGQEPACSACTSCSTPPALPAAPVALQPLATAVDTAPALQAAPTALAPERLERPPRSRLA
jgi:hypothetical protein